MSAVSDAIAALPPLRATIEAAGLQASRALGQNFLLDLNLTASITRLVKNLPDYEAIEIGPGPGGLTRALLMGGAQHVHAFELDARAIEALQPLVQAAQGRLTLHHKDALHVNPMAIGTNGKRIIVANLPYNIATPLLFNWLALIDIHGTDALCQMVLMFQKEVAERIVATPSSKAYGRLAVMAQHVCAVKIAKILPPDAFTPPPAVHSAIVTFTPHAPKATCRFETLEKIVAASFQQRRKMLRQSLKPYVSALEACGIDPTLRAENLSVPQFEALAMMIEKSEG